MVPDPSFTPGPTEQCGADADTRRQLRRGLDDGGRMDPRGHYRRAREDFQKARQRHAWTRDFDLVGNPRHVWLQGNECSLDRARLHDRRHRCAIDERKIVLVFSMGGIHHPPDLNLRISQEFAAEFGR